MKIYRRSKLFGNFLQDEPKLYRRFRCPGLFGENHSYESLVEGIGIISGGEYSSVLSYVDIYNFGMDFCIEGNNLGSPRKNHCAAGFSSLVFFCGGEYGSPLTSTAKYYFHSQTQVSGPTLSSNKTQQSACSRTDAAFVFGGSEDGVSSVSYYGIYSLPNDTFYGTYGYLTETRKYMAAFGSGVNGFTAGGTAASESTYYAITDKIVYSSGSQATGITSLSTARAWLAGASNSTKGVFAAGKNSNTLAVTDYYTNLSGSSQNRYTGTSLGSSTFALCASSTTSFAYFFGGYGQYKTVYKYRYSDNVVASASSLSTSVYRSAAASNCHGGLISV
jgi:hypothetical protein